MTRRILAVGLLALLSSPVAAQDVCTAWQMTETLRIGSVAGDVTLTGVLSLTVGPDENIYVTEALTPYVSIFSREGRPSGQLGRAGQGPGEFEVVALDAGWLGDTLWVSDLFKTQLFDRSGQLVRQINFTVPVPEEGSLFRPGRLLADGSVLGRRVLNGYDRFMASTMRPAVRRFSASGEIVDTLALLDRSESVIEFEWTGGNIRYATHPLRTGSRESHADHLLAVSPNGSWVVTIDEVAPEAESPSFRLVRIALGGDTISARRIAYEPRQVTRAESSRLREEFAAWQAGDYFPPQPFATSEAVLERQRRWARDGYWSPQYHVPVRDLLVGADGSIWLLREPRPDRSDLWEIYSSEGQLEGHLIVEDGQSSPIPFLPKARFLHVSRDEIWATTVDELEVPYIHRYRVDRSCNNQ